MATVSNWTPFGVALDITATAGTVTRISATKFTVKINASWETYYNGASTNYGMLASSGGASATLNKFGTNSSSGSGSFTGTFTISGNGSATKTVTVTFKNYEEDWQGNVTESASKTISLNVTVPAWTSYKVTYNANGGGGAPSAQTKWKDQTLKLSTTKPTRTGYDFQGWATSASGSVAYAAGANYTSNAAVTLYAVWKAKTYTVTYNANGGSGAPGNQTKTYGKSLTLSTTKPTRTGYDFQGWATSASGSVVYASGASYTANSAVTLYAVWKIKTYAVKYNANGGTGAPSAQTKTYGKTLALSSTKPTRTGYTFQGWATSANGSVAYAAGASYTNNAAITLYAIWTAKTYTVSYNANGGTGAPSSQTKTHGSALTLSGTKPTRANYTFKGWGTSASATTVAYNPGASYTANAAVTLYAIWELSYVKPKISSFSVSRCNSSGTASDDGTYCRVKFNWTSGVANPTALIEWKDTENKNESVTLSGTSGTVNQIIGGSFSTEKSYSIKATVDDGKSPQSSTRSLPGVVFPIDVKAGGTGVAIGKAAELSNRFDVGYVSRFRKDVLFGEKTDYQDGKPGVLVDADGYVHIQRSSNGGYHPYIGFYLDDETSPAGSVRVNCNTRQMEFVNSEGYKFGKDIYLPNACHLKGLTTAGVSHALIYISVNDNTVVGYGGYENNNGNTNIYGKQVFLYVKAGPNAKATYYKPYYEAGDSFDINIRTAGFVSNSGKDVMFTIPLAKPIVGSPVVSVATRNGGIFRQGGKYTHGSTADTNAKPESYTVYVQSANSICVRAAFTDITNAINNDVIGVHWDGTITFE